jgi:hypothetical protein
MTRAFGEFLQTPLGGTLVALVVGILLLGSAASAWRPLKAWRWRRAAQRLPDYLRSRSQRYVGTAKIYDINDRIRARDQLCREMGEFVNRAGVSRQTLAHSSHEGLVVALAGAIAAAPQAGDDQLIVLTDNSQLSGSTQHKILDALSVLAAQPGLIPSHRHASVAKWVDGIADKEPSLPAKIRVLKAMLQ